MKKYLLSALLLALVSLTPLVTLAQRAASVLNAIQPQPENNYSVLPYTTPANTNTLISRFGSSKEYDWNVNTTIWDYAEEGRFIYDTKGNLLVRYYLAPTTLDTLGKVVASYDANNLQTWRGSYNYDAIASSWTYLSYDSNYFDARKNNVYSVTRYFNATTSLWVNSLQVINTYDSFGNRTETRTDSWNANAGGWETITGRKTAYTYTPQGYPSTLLTSTWSSANGVYEDKEIDSVLVNAAGVPTGFYAWLMTPNGFVLRLKYDSLTWYDYTSPLLATSKPSKYIVQGRGQGRWVDSLRNVTTYGSTGTYTIAVDRLTLVGWQPSRRQTSSYDQNGFYTGLVIQTYNASAGGFTTVLGFKRLPTYAPNGLDLLEVINQSWASASQSYENTTRSTYTDFTQITGLDKVAERGNLKIYPNPATGWVNVKTQAGILGTIAITSAIGQRVYQATIDGESIQTINLDAFNKGIYFIKVKQDGLTVKSSKLIVR